MGTAHHPRPIVVGSAHPTGIRTDTWSNLRTAQHSVVESLRDAVPIAFELERVRHLTRELIPEIQAS